MLGFRVYRCRVYCVWLCDFFVAGALLPGGWGGGGCLFAAGGGGGGGGVG